MQPNYCRASNVASGSTSSTPTSRQNHQGYSSMKGNNAQQQAKNNNGRGANRNGNQGASYNRKAHSVSPLQPCFATSQFCHSPAARKIPLPPTNWFKANEPSSTPTSPSPSSGASSPSHEQNENITGLRVCPLQLIAAVASS